MKTIIIACLWPLVACVAVAPPPIATAHGLPIPDEKGATTVTVVVATGLEFRRPGLDIRVNRQVRDDLKLGASLGGGWNLRKNDWIQGIIATRLIGMYNPKGTSNVGMPFGVGLGAATNGMVYATVDTGVIANTPGDSGAYGYPVFALSVPLRKGKPWVHRRWGSALAKDPMLPDEGRVAQGLERQTDTISSYARTTFWFGIIVGAQVMYEQWTTSIETGAVLGSHGLTIASLLSLGQSRR